MEPNPKYGNQDEEMNEDEFIELFLKDEQIEVKPNNTEEK
jgi:hypothetical protein